LHVLLEVVAEEEEAFERMTHVFGRRLLPTSQWLGPYKV